MDRYEFLNRLSVALSKLPQNDRTEAINFYDEIISDKIEAGQSEQEAVASLGDISILRAYITAESVENSMLGGEGSKNFGKGSKAAEDTGKGGVGASSIVPPSDNRNATNVDEISPKDTKNQKTEKVSHAREAIRHTKTAIKQTVEKAKTPIKNFFTVFAVCTSPVLLVLGITFLVVLLSLIVSFASVGIGLVAGSIGSLVYGIITATYINSSMGGAAAVMTVFAYVLASAILAILAVLFFMLSKIIIKSVVLLFARLVKRNRAKQIPAKEGM